MVIQRKFVEDRRGFFSRLYCSEDLRSVGFNKTIMQINHTLTKQIGTVRGLHFQYPPYAEMKMVSCVKGKIFDVAVDLRKGSPTFLHWHGEVLSEKNRKSFLIPEGFAHGFQSLTDDCELLYLHTATYKPDSEGALNVREPLLNIDWPMSISDLSDRDKSHPFIDTDFQGVVV
jgi:dTDP-4-dehydrorhamnose 3,5-epimerase